MPVLLALGANLPSRWGDPAQTLSVALGKLSERTNGSVNSANLFQTPAFPKGEDPDFVNTAARLDAEIDPTALLEICHEIEKEADRNRDNRWAARTLDLDLIAFDDQILPDPATQTRWRTLPLDEQIRQTPDELILPHPRLQDRAFVLVPLAEVAPTWVHPILGLTPGQMLAGLPKADIDAIQPYKSS